MNFETLLEFLELESADEFEYFENLADLVEADAEILPEAVYQLFEGIESSWRITLKKCSRLYRRIPLRCIRSWSR